MGSRSPRLRTAPPRFASDANARGDVLRGKVSGLHSAPPGGRPHSASAVSLQEPHRMALPANAKNAASVTHWPRLVRQSDPPPRPPAMGVVVVPSRPLQHSVVAWGREALASAPLSEAKHYNRSDAACCQSRRRKLHTPASTYQDEYFFITNVTLSPQQIVKGDTEGWSIETTFQECRKYLKLESPGLWPAQRPPAHPCMFGFYIDGGHDQISQ
jgi:hypothetical protein